MKEKLHRLSQEDRLSLVNRLSDLLAARPEVSFAYLFGSFAEGLPFHDIDIGVYLRSEEDADEPMPGVNLANRLSDELQLPVDVRVLNRAPISFAFHAVRGELLIERDSNVRGDFVEYIIARYLDMKPLLRQAAKEAFSR